jgi:hypothetical protein
MKVKIAYTYTGVHPQKAKRKKDFLWLISNGKDTEHLEFVHTAHGNINWYNYHINYAYLWCSNSIFRHLSHRNIYKYSLKMGPVVLFMTAPNCKQPKCTSRVATLITNGQSLYTATVESLCWIPSLS